MKQKHDRSKYILLTIDDDHANAKTLEVLGIKLRELISEYPAITSMVSNISCFEENPWFEGYDMIYSEPTKESCEA